MWWWIGGEGKGGAGEGSWSEISSDARSGQKNFRKITLKIKNHTSKGNSSLKFW